MRTIGHRAAITLGMHASVPLHIQPQLMVLDFPRTIRLNINRSCNLTCRYAETGRSWCYLESEKSKEKGPEIEELSAVVQLLAKRYGIEHVKFGGTEPTIHPQLIQMIERMSDFGFSEVSMTTNGVLLGRLADDLVRAGISRVTVSIQSFDERVYPQVTGRAVLRQVLLGIDKMLAHGIPVKINRILMQESRHDLPLFLRWIGARKLTVRLYELMDLPGHSNDLERSYLNADDVFQLVADRVESVHVTHFEVPNRYVWRYVLDDGASIETKTGGPRQGVGPLACLVCSHRMNCDTGYLGCGIRVMPDLGIRVCILNEQLEVPRVHGSSPMYGDGWLDACDRLLAGNLLVSRELLVRYGAAGLEANQFTKDLTKRE